MDLLDVVELSIPAYQMAMLLLISTLALVAGKTRLALLITYLFTLHWGYVFINGDSLAGVDVKTLNIFTMIYFGLGLAIAFFAALRFLMHEE